MKIHAVVSIDYDGVNFEITVACPDGYNQAVILVPRERQIVIKTEENEIYVEISL